MDCYVAKIPRQESNHPNQYPGFMFIDNYLPESGPFAGAEIDPASLEVELDEPPSTAAEPTPAIAEEEQREVLPNSVAVLPFENLSPDPDNAYYAAGFHEEILNQLAKLSALNVIARTSMRQYANTEKSIPEIAEELNVQTVMEGSVRYADDRIRITTQLNDGITGAHLWSETYTRDFDDIFAIESDVAMNVANALAVEFSLAEQQSIEELPTDSTEAYVYYLRALAGDANNQSYLDQAIALDPEFALAYAEKAYWYAFELTGQSGANPSQAAELERAVENNANQALILNSSLGTAQAALAVLHQVNWRAREAEDAFQQAIELSPNDVDVLVLYGRFKRYRGDHTESVRHFRRALELDPNNGLLVNQIAIGYRWARNWDASATAYQANLDRSPTSISPLVGLTYVEAARGNSVEAGRLLQIAEQLEPAPFRLAQMAEAYALLGRGDDAMRMFNLIEERANSF